MMAAVEAFIDFSEDENIEEDVLDHGNGGTICLLLSSPNRTVFI